MKKSPVGSWRSFFNLGKSSSVSKRKLQRNESEPSEMKAMALKGECSCLPFPLRPGAACMGAAPPVLSHGSPLTRTHTPHVVVTGANRVCPPCAVSCELSSTNALSPDT